MKKLFNLAVAAILGAIVMHFIIINDVTWAGISLVGLLLFIGEATLD